MCNMETDPVESRETPITVAEMRALEAAAIASGEVSGEELMERAGSGISSKILELVSGPGPKGALVLAGPGNNGGDGYVVARHLADAGWWVTVAGLGEAAKMPDDARLNRQRWEIQADVWPLAHGLPDVTPDLILDAVFGIGLTRPIEGALAAHLGAAAELAKATDALRVAVDLPSGLETDTGQVLGTVLAADQTITFHRPKPAHLKRPDLCGALTIVDIGI